MKWILPLIILSLVAIGISFTYVDIDETAVVAYHSQGEDASIQPHYSVYINGYDLILSAMNKLFCNNNEHSILVSSFIFNLICLIIVMMISQQLLFEKFNSDNRVYFFFWIIPFAIPEIVFWGLDITEGICALAFMITGYFILTRKNILKQKTFFLLACLILGFGIFLRWEIGLFSIFIALDLFFRRNYSLPTILLIAVLSGVGLFSSLYLSGYSFAMILDVIKAGNEYTAATEFSRMGIVGANLTLFTPAAIVLLIAGIYKSVKNKLHLELLFLLVLFGGYLILMHGFFIPKSFIFIFFIILIITYQGYVFIIETLKAKWALVVASLVVLMLPWLVGFTISSDQTAWGPGFDLKEVSKASTEKYERNPDKRLKNIVPKITLGSGFAISTPEGPRPLWGYIYVLLFDWKKLNQKMEDELNNVVIALAKSEKKYKIILSDNRNSLNVISLNRYNYRTKDSMLLERRCFVHINGTDSIHLQIAPRKITADYLSQFNKDDDVIFSVTYSSLITVLTTQYQNIKRTGPFTAKLVEKNN